MNRKSCILLLIYFILVCGCNNAPDFIINLPPPPDSAWPEDIYPAEIEGVKPVTYTAEYGGTIAVYQDKGTLYVGRKKDEKEATQFFKQTILPGFEKMAISYTGSISGQFYAKSGNKDSICFGWINNRYIFVLKASDEKALQKMAAGFRYIKLK
ncbi:MAG: hypothetical protein U0W24_06995 [Bacteroidales bacterium]